MDASEQKLISDLYVRMRGMQGIAKDPDAAALIHQESAANPDAAYLLTQSVLVQEQALQKAQARITELEGQASALERAPATPTANAGFMSGAVPSVGAGGRGRPMGVPASAMAANDASDAPAARGRGGEARGGQSGGFMAQAMTTAAGVAGGMLLASGISSLLGGSGAQAASGGATETAAATPAAEAEKPTETASNEQQPAEDDSFQQASHDDAAGDDSWGGFEDFGDFGDLDI